jgi:hypothetical protein
MKRYRVIRIDVPAYPILRLTFEDGLTGDLDLARDIERGSPFEGLRDESFFRAVAIAEDGRSFGWRLDDLFNEIDFGADGARADIESALVQARAERHRRKLLHAAE